MMTQAYHDRFSGVESVYNSDALARFARAHVCVIGIGGVGAWSAEALARSGVGTLTLIDLDEICVTNINRQLHALTSTIGRSKVATLRARLLDINPELIVHGVERFYTEKSELELLGSPADPPRFDVVIDAIDHTTRKSALARACLARALPLVICGAAGGRRDPTRVRVADLSLSTHDALLRNVKRSLRRAAPERFGDGLWGITSVFSVEDTRAPSLSAAPCSIESATESATHITTESATESAIRRRPRACETSYGSLTFVTGTFGFVAAGATLELLLSASEPPNYLS